MDLLDHELLANQNPMFGRRGQENSFFDDDDYAYQKELKAKVHNRKMAALSYDTASYKSKVAGNQMLQPVLKEQGR